MVEHDTGRGGAAEPAAGEIVIERVFDAPRELVFRAWTEPQHMLAWWGPRGFSLPHCTVDLRPGGLLHYCMRSPEGQDIWGRGVYREVVVPERIVVTDSFSDEQGNVVPATRYGLSAEWPLEALLTVTFAEEAGGKTRLTLRHAIGAARVEELGGTREAWTESLERLAEHLTQA